MRKCDLDQVGRYVVRPNFIIAALMGAVLLAASAPQVMAAGARSSANTPAKISPRTAPNPNYVPPRERASIQKKLKDMDRGTLRRTALNPRCRWGGHPCR